MALPLHPVDGELDNFSSKQGEVENFVLLPYGTASESGVADNPRIDSNYYWRLVHRLVTAKAKARATCPRVPPSRSLSRRMAR
jgi:hypothetical protein